jgi:hypothetical protein
LQLSDGSLPETDDDAGALPGPTEPSSTDSGGAMSLIALEEHYAWDPASAENPVATWLRSNNEVAYQRLYDRGPLLEQMNAAGIDFQILSLFDPGVASGWRSCWTLRSSTAPSC